MSLHRSSRNQNKAKQTHNPITNYGSVKCRLNLTEDGNNGQAKRLPLVDLPAMPAQMSEISKQNTPKSHLKSTSTPISCQMDELEVLKQNTSKLCPSVTVVSMSSAVSPVVNPNCGNVAPTKTPILSSISNDTATTSTASTNGNLEKDNYAGLSSAIKDSLEYPLPTKFQRLYDHFLMLEKVMSVNVHEKNRLTFDDLAKLVERKTRKALPLSSFAQIMGVYPKAYNLSLTKKRETKAEKTYLENYCTPLAPSPTKVPLETRVNDSSVELISMMLQECHLDHRNRLAPWRMACRRAIFRYKLYLLVAREHEVFLNKIGADKNAIPCGKFHEKFNLDSVADVIPAKMPEPPKIKLITDFLKTVKTVSKAPEKAEDIPKMSLYERITEKQRRRDEKLASARQNVINRRKYLEVLRDSAFFMIWSMFRTRYPKTTTFKLTDVISRICSQIKTLSASECTDVIDVLCEVVPRYFDVFTAGVNSCKYMRVNMQDSETDYCKILQTITAEHKLVESS